MARFEVKYSETIVNIGYVEADSMEEALEMFEQGQIEDVQDVDILGDLGLMNIKEV